MDTLLEKWNNKWKTLRLQFLMEGVEKRISDFFEQLTIQNIDSCDYQQDGFYISMHIHCKNEVTNEYFTILFANFGDDIMIKRKDAEDNYLISWTGFFGITETNLELELLIPSILYSFDFEQMLKEVEELEESKTEELRNILLQNTTIRDDIKQTKSFQNFLKTGLLQLNKEEFLCLFWNVGEGEEDDDEDEIEYPAVYARYENEECYDEEITKWKTDPKLRLVHLVNDYGNPNERIEKSIIGFIEYAEKYNQEGK